MSRSGYSTDLENWALIRWRGQVASAIRGKRGQRFLRELRDALDALDPKELVAGEFIREDGAVCALGAVARAQGIAPNISVDMYDWDECDNRSLAVDLDIAYQLVCEVEFCNDDAPYRHAEDAAAVRWKYVRAWVEAEIVPSSE